MLNEVKPPHAGFLALARNDILALVMLSGAKHPCTRFLTDIRNNKKSVRNDTALVMLNEVKHPCSMDSSQRVE